MPSDLSPDPIWTPDPADVAAARITEFAAIAAQRAGRDLPTYAELLAWSVAEPAAFWRCLWDFFDVRSASGSETVLTDDAMPGARWFPDARLNYVDQVFRGRPDDGVAIVECDETGRHDEIHLGASCVTTSRRSRRRCAATASASVTGSSPTSPTVPRPSSRSSPPRASARSGRPAGWTTRPARRARPVRLSSTRSSCFTADGYRNGGKVYDRAGAVAEIRAGLPSVRATIAADRIGAGRPARCAGVDGLPSRPTSPSTPSRSRSTTRCGCCSRPGRRACPKGIVHGHGGVLLEHLKAVGLQCDLGPGDVFWWYTTPSWMMWNFQVAGLLTGATIVCYDGSPAYPTTDAVWALAARLGVTYLGTSPAYLAACAKADVHPGTDHDLHALRTLGVTGSTLAAPMYRWAAEHVGARVQVASITGGTDVVTAFAGSAPNVPVWAGEISAAFLGVALDSFDDSGRSVRDEVGELVVTAPMPSMPVRFWDDPDGARYREAYFDTYPGVWRHGDWVTISSRGSVVMHGRSDATLNRNGIRMGSADIYEAVEQLPEIAEALVIGVDENGGGYWMPLFVQLQPGAELDDALRDRIRTAVREHASPRHVPDEVIAAPGIPHTRTGKKLEVPIKKLLSDSAAKSTFDPGSVDDPSLVDWFVAQGEAHRRSRS